MTTLNLYTIRRFAGSMALLVLFLFSSLTAKGQVTITTDLLPDGVVGERYRVVLEANSRATVTWSIAHGALPAGLNLVSGIIGGKPTTAGAFTVTIKAAAGALFSDSKTFMITIINSSKTYQNLYAAVQGETNANAHYLAFAAKARQEGYYEIANLFTATAAAEATHASSEWNMLVAMGATAVEKPVADTPTVGTTAENLQAAINGETYEYTVMYPGFAADATAEGNTDAANLFTRTGKVENIHANNYTDALNHLGDMAYLNATFSMIYLCPVCGAIFDVATIPSSGRCSVCGTAQSLFVQYKTSRTYAELMAAVQGETNANAHYLAFAAKARQEGYHEVASLFTATATAEALHAASEWALLVKMGATAAEKPVADTPTVGTTAENLQAAINGETYEYTTMYPGFAADATAEGKTEAANLFTRTGRVENIHANNYTDALLNLNDMAYLNATFSMIYLCPVCGAVFDVATIPSSGRCSVCGVSQSLFIQYKASRTYADLMTAVQGETNANAHYLAFAAKARAEGYPEIARLFTATAAAEAIHALDEWNMLVTMGATAAEKPVADTPIVGTTAENLQAAINGETYEYQVMYPGFAADATAEGNTEAASLFTRTGKVEKIHANNYQDALNNLNNAAYLKATFGTLYLCPVCGAVFDVALPTSGRCSVCGTPQSLYVQYVMSTYTSMTGNVGQATDLKAWVENGTLYVSGLTAGKQWSVYTAAGTLIHQGIATGDEATQSLAFQGVYIVQSENRTVKVMSGP